MPPKGYVKYDETAHKLGAIDLSIQTSLSKIDYERKNLKRLRKLRHELEREMKKRPQLAKPRPLGYARVMNDLCA